MIIKKNRFLNIILSFFAIVLLIIIDQLVKNFILLSPNFQHTCNQGIAFGLVVPIFILSLFWISIMSYLFYLLWQNKDSLTKSIPYWLIIAGGLSNVLDRFFYNCVIDYIYFFNISVFNLADTFITVGVILLIFNLNKDNL
jgi:signal peptidase II